MNSRAFALLFCMFLFSSRLVAFAEVQRSRATTIQSERSAVPEMDRLAQALVGDWNTTETMERSEIFPNGGSPHRVVHGRLAGGGTTLLYESPSYGPARQIDGQPAVLLGERGRLLP